MPFFIALAVLIAGSSAYLLHQFWSHSLSSADEAQTAGAATDEQTQPNHLKAA